VCGYYLGYDWTMMLRELPDRALYSLFRPELRVRETGGFFPVEWRGYRLHYLAGMMRIGRRGQRHGTTVWDLGRFFQSPFVRALERWGIDAPVADIAEMKALRATFGAGDARRVRAYCLSECQALARLATALESVLSDVGIEPRRWHGPGSVASVLLDRWGARDARGTPPAGVREAAERAFFGGRFEQACVGTHDVYGADIASAYPYHARSLPCLAHGTWERVLDEGRADAASVALYRYAVTDVGERSWGPLPCRMPDGSILYPRGGWSGWAWASEYRAAQRGWSGVHWGGEAWVWHAGCDHQPFSGILPMYRERVKLGKDVRGLALKLGLNSCYGKLAQRIGTPRYASTIWAGMITAGTRAQLLDLMIASGTEATVAVATDGLYTRARPQPGPAPLAPDTLGSWELDAREAMTFVRPGIYWSADKVRARGIGRSTVDMQRAAIGAAIERGDALVDLGTQTQFGGARATIIRTERGAIRRTAHYGQWYEAPARISLDPAPKRRADWSLYTLPGIESRAYAGETTPEGEMARAAESPLHLL